MIIDDEAPSSPTKLDQSQALPTTRREVPEDAPPPAYTGPSTSYLAPAHDAHAEPSSPLLDSEAQLPKEEPAGRRFFKAFAIAIAIWFTVAIISGGTIRSTYSTIRETVLLPKRRPSNLQPKDGKVLECHTGRKRLTQTTGAAHSMSLEMAMPPEAFYLFARGGYTKGRLVVVHDSDWTHRNTIKVDIQAVTAHSNLLDEIAVCQMERKKGERGVALLAPDTDENQQAVSTLTWLLKVHLPPSFDYGPLVVPAFETLLPRFAHSFEEMHDEVMFGFLGIAATNGKIFARSVYAETAQLLTANGAVEGNIAANHLEIVASNQPIRANITVFKDGDNNGTLFLKNSNSYIYVDLALLDAIPARESGAGTFHAVARTSNAPLDLVVYDLPLDADTHIAVRASNGGARLRLPHAYDGGFHLHAVNAPTEVRFDAAVRDPGDRGRERHMYKRRIDRNRLVGSVGWVAPGDRQEPRGGLPSRVEGRKRRGGRRMAGSDDIQERRRRFREMFDELEGERRDVGVQTSPEVWSLDWREWDPSVHGNYSSSALVVSTNGPAVLDLT